MAKPVLSWLILDSKSISRCQFILFFKPMEDTRNLTIWFFWPCAPCSHRKREASLLHPSEENGSEVLNSTFIYLDALDISFQLYFLYV